MLRSMEDLDILADHIYIALSLLRLLLPHRRPLWHLRFCLYRRLCGWPAIAGFDAVAR